MISERDFVLNFMINNFTNYNKEGIDFCKQQYKFICENTSEESDDFIYEIEKSFKVIKFKEIREFYELDGAYKVFDNHHDYQCWHKVLEKERFKQWFERKRGIINDL